MKKHEEKIVEHGKGVYALEKWEGVFKTSQQKLETIKTSKKWDDEFVQLVENALVQKHD